MSNVATGGASSTGGGAGQGGATGGAPIGGSANAATGNGGSTRGGAGSGGSQGGTGGTCFAVETKSETISVDMYVMFDQSQSMSAMLPGSSPPTTWWNAGRQAFTNFVQDPAAGGIGVGIQFFPYKGSIAGSDPGAPSSSCYVPNYATPEVEIGLLPGNAQALVQAIEAHAPTTFTPTAAALRGAVQHMQAWGAAHPGRQPAVALVTDGYPTECDPQDLPLIAQIAQAAYEGTPRVMTFVVGFESGGSLDNLGLIAKAGGTGDVVSIRAGDISRQFVQALLGVTKSPLPCDFALPSGPNPGSPPDLGQVWVHHVPQPASTPTVIPHVSSLVGCAASGGGWYFDAPNTPTKVLVCPETCSQFAGGSVIVGVGSGCTPQMP
jgi:hypothetical protein